MKTRIITGVVALAIFLPFVVFSHTPAFIVFTVLATAIAVYEMCNCMKQCRKLPQFVLSELYGILCALATRLSSNFLTTFMALTAVYAFLIAGIALFSKEKYPLDRAVMLICGVVYVVFGFSSIVMVRDLTNGVLIFWLIFIAAWLSDTGAYFVGVRFGKHKLIPDVSPKKTVEGLLGGIATCVAIFLIYAGLVSLISEQYKANFLSFFVAGVLLSLVSVFGDLLASFIKRRFKVKDYGFIFPGHGGIMDRFDSVLAVSIVLYIFCTNVTFMPLFR